MDMESKKPYMMVTIIQVIYTIMFLISKAVFNGGMNTFVFVFYRQAFATIFLAPLAFFFERKSAPPLSFVTFIKIFMLSLFGVTLSLDLNGVALSYTSATLAAATTASLPAITFFLALLFGMERLKVKSIQGTAKLVGITVCMGGVITLALYKGPLLKLPLCPHFYHGQEHPHHNNPGHVSGGSTSWLKGCVLMITSNILWGLWLVLQGRVLKVYPSKLYFTTLHCLLSSIQSFVIAIVLERDISAWKLGWNLRLVAVIYCGFIVTGVAYYLQSWVIEKRGPVFLSMFTPLSLLFTLLSSAILLCEIISLGSIVGGLLLIIGLYCVLWGKSKEKKNSGDDKTDLQKENDVVCNEVKVVVS
ncbi:nodulin MtN21 family protein [Arabidopsis lyrata subsp. lyrata]|uniref:WAT1-related protein n=1 Tax=Arabidopsis lyrata subsp. lyrata TaxID=81972 RepID=D7MSI8_ARALL|nr:WAT1-related protein At5g64700 [Arabidopsis lyrata subsp. lyrata]EFH42890.1 nodulin MtN21 family protein [Arabidopsis lyrata subsp. lyrata]|eukprot:XP_002866631.1 WAT1-related protein At5g64700 [Arabidopsis lyrata subsp. lyrata]